MVSSQWKRVTSIWEMNREKSKAHTIKKCINTIDFDLKWSKERGREKNFHIKWKRFHRQFPMESWREEKTKYYVPNKIAEQPTNRTHTHTHRKGNLISQAIQEQDQEQYTTHNTNTHKYISNRRQWHMKCKVNTTHTHTKCKGRLQTM